MCCGFSSDWTLQHIAYSVLSIAYSIGKRYYCAFAQYLLPIEYAIHAIYAMFIHSCNIRNVQMEKNPQYTKHYFLLLLIGIWVTIGLLRCHQIHCIEIWIYLNCKLNNYNDAHLISICCVLLSSYLFFALIYRYDFCCFSLLSHNHIGRLTKHAFVGNGNSSYLKDL